MNFSEAQQVLIRNHYCPIHLTKMDKRTNRHPLENATYDSYECSKCVQEQAQKNKAELEEALDMYRSVRKGDGGIS